jgi:hypothetical protein
VQLSPVGRMLDPHQFAMRSRSPLVASAFDERPMNMLLPTAVTAGVTRSLRVCVGLVPW